MFRTKSHGVHCHDSRGVRCPNSRGVRYPNSRGVRCPNYRGIYYPNLRAIHCRYSLRIIRDVVIARMFVFYLKRDQEILEISIWPLDKSRYCSIKPI